MKKTLTTLFFIGFTSLCFAQKPLAWYNHTQLNVKNLDTSVAFYTKVFGFDTIPCPFPNSAKKIVKWLNVGENCQIHLIENVGDTTHIVFDGHLGINVRSLQEIKERLLKYSYSYQTGKLKMVSEGKMPYGAKMAFFKDPDGHLIHVIEDTQLSYQPTLPEKESEIRRLENLEREAVLKGDTSALFKIWSPNMVVHNPVNKVITMTEVKMRLGTGQLDYSSFERTIEKITFDDNVAIVMGEEKLKPQGLSNHAGKLVTRRFTNIWKFTNNQWSEIGRQATIVKIE